MIEGVLRKVEKRILETEGRLLAAALLQRVERFACELRPGTASLMKRPQVH
jgi:hypothetical protein